MFTFMRKLFGRREQIALSTIEDVAHLRRVARALMTLINEVNEALRRHMDYKLVITRLLLGMVPVIVRLDDKPDDK
jgi:hypothetical protein